MRYGLITTSIPEKIAQLGGKIPMALVDVLIPLLQVRAIMNGVKLGVFDALGDGPRSVGEIAAQVGADAEALGLLLRVLESSGYVKRSGGLHELTTLGRRTFLPGAPQDSRGTVLFAFHEWELIERLDELLRTGRTADFHHTLSDPQVWEHYQTSMLEMARNAADIVAGMIPLDPGARAMLDIAGAHGLYGAALCRRHKSLRSTVLDLPQALPIARRLAEAEGITDVVTHVEGDMLAGGYPPNQDLVLFSNILHHFTPEQNQAIVGHAFEALHHGGTIAIWDVERRPDSAPPELGGDAMGLFFRLTSNSSVFRAEEYASWLLQAGFADIRTKRSVLLPSMVLTTGKKA